MKKNSIEKRKEFGALLSGVNAEFEDPSSYLEDTDEEGHRLHEMAQINSPEDELGDGIKILVFAEEKSLKKEPHFHFRIERQNEYIDIEVCIKDILSMTIIASKTGNTTWDGLTEPYIKVRNWLEQTACDSDMLNKEAIRQEWNRNNMFNRVLKKEL